jgi:hypothetical protein
MNALAYSVDAKQKGFIRLAPFFEYTTSKNYFVVGRGFQPKTFNKNGPLADFKSLQGSKEVS